MKITRAHSSEVQETLLPPGCIQAMWSPNNTQGPVLSTEHVGMHWTASHFEGFWSKTQVKLRGATNGVLSTVDLLAHYKARTFKSELLHFILLCKTVHSHKGEMISVSHVLLSRVFILFCPLLQLHAAHRETQKQSMWRAGRDSTSMAVKMRQVLKQKL